MKFPLVLLFVLSWLSAFNQPVARYPDVAGPGIEQISVQINSTFLLTGETLYFRIFCRQHKNNKPTMLSKVAYLELIDESGTPVFQTKISLQTGSGNGDFFIPSSFPSGNYSLIAYTRWMKNFTTDSFYTNQITIVNPFKLTVEVATTRAKELTRENIPAHSQSNGIQLQLSGRIFNTREKVSVTLTGMDSAAVCVSVRKKEATLDDAGTMLKPVAIEVAGDDKPPDNSISPFPTQTDLISSTRGKTHLPEIRGHLITGKLIPKTEVISKRTILASIPGSDFVFRATATDQHGDFVMIVDRIPESSTMLFQVLDDDINAYTLDIEDPFLGDYLKFRPEPLAIDTSLRRIIDERNVYTQIENAYYETQTDSLSLAPPTSFYNIPGKTYRLDDFTRFPAMEDIFREYVPEVILKHLKGAFSLHVVNPRTGYPYAKEPLILIDGVPILNTNTLMTYDPLKVDLIEIVKDKYFYGALESDGIISLKTYKGAIGDLPSINSHRESLVKIQSGRVYSFPDHSTDKVKWERVPDYRLQLYWNPDVSSRKGQVTSVDFHTSDVVGDFEIIVEGFSSDGELVTTREVFSVLR